MKITSLRDLAAGLITAALIIAALVLGRAILAPLAIAGIACFVLVPISRYLLKLGAPNVVATSLVALAATGLVIGAATALSSQLLSLTAELPAYRTNVMAKVEGLVGKSVPTSVVGRAIDAIDTYQQAILEQMQSKSGQAPDDQNASGGKKDENTSKEKVVVKDEEGTSWQRLGVILEPLAQVALTFLFSLFLLSQYKDLRDRVVRLFGKENMSDTTEAMADAGERLSALFIGQAILNLAFGVVVGLALTAIGVPNAPLWGVVAAIMRWVPFIGIYIAAVPPILLAAAVDPGWTKTVLTFAIFAIGEPVMGQILEPIVLGKRAGLSPFAMVLATSFWTLVWGPIGLVLAAPLTLIIVVLGKYVPNLDFLNILLGDEPPLTPPYDMYQRLLSADTFSAIAQVEEIDEPQKALDDVVFPALKLASNDHRRGRIEEKTLDELEQSVDELIAAVFEEAGDGHHPSLLLIPVRGKFDMLASRCAAGAINSSALGHAKALAEGSGLTAISSIAGMEADEVHDVVFVALGGVSPKVLSHLSARVLSALPKSRISVLDLSGGGAFVETPIQRFVSVRDLVSARVRGGDTPRKGAAREPAKLLQWT